MKEMYSKQVNITSRFANDLQIGLILFQVQSASIYCDQLTTVYKAMAI